jgi:hypothetical protein
MVGESAFTVKQTARIQIENIRIEGQPTVRPHLGVGLLTVSA